jgi:hypothetical protein
MMRPMSWLAVMGLLVATPALAGSLAAHQAHYKLALQDSRGDVAAATGTMNYRFEDVCVGWATRQRLDMVLTNSDGQDIHMVSDYATLESKDGLHMQFHMRQTTDTAVTAQVDGEASLSRVGGQGEVRYTAPEIKTVKLPAGTVFPTPHTQALLDAAVAGKKFLALPLFDGTSEHGPQDTFVTILNWRGPSEAPFKPLAELPSGRFQIAFFDRSNTGSSSQPDSGTPDYSVAMRYWSNGVSDALAMDFGDFVMKGTMDKFELLPPHC